MKQLSISFILILLGNYVLLLVDSVNVLSSVIRDVFSFNFGFLKDPFKIFYEAGANLIRIRLWHNPKWTNYSN